MQSTPFQVLYLNQDETCCKQLSSHAATVNVVVITKAMPLNTPLSSCVQKKPFLALIVEEAILNPTKLVPLEKKISEIEQCFPHIPLFLISADDNWNPVTFKEFKNTYKNLYMIEAPLAEEQLTDLFAFILKTYEYKQEVLHQSDHSKDYLQELKESYKQSISDKIDHFEKLTEAFVHHPTQDSLSDLMKNAHKIGGSAGGYGYPKVSALCKQLENDLREKISSLENCGIDCKTILATDYTIKLKFFLKSLKFYFQIH